jgi:flagellar hook-associated protein 1
LSTTALQNLGGQSVMDYYHTLATNIAVKGAAAVAELEASNAIVLSLSAQRESISGVNLDEEVIALMKMERAFGAAARFTTVVDRLMDEVLALVR